MTCKVTRAVVRCFIFLVNLLLLHVLVLLGIVIGTGAHYKLLGISAGLTIGIFASAFVILGLFLYNCVSVCKRPAGYHLTSSLFLFFAGIIYFLIGYAMVISDGIVNMLGATCPPKNDVQRAVLSGVERRWSCCGWNSILEDPSCVEEFGYTDECHSAVITVWDSIHILFGLLFGIFWIILILVSSLTLCVTCHGVGSWLLMEEENEEESVTMGHRVKLEI